MTSVEMKACPARSSAVGAEPEPESESLPHAARASAETARMASAVRGIMVVLTLLSSEKFRQRLLSQLIMTRRRRRKCASSGRHPPSAPRR